MVSKAMEVLTESIEREYSKYFTEDGRVNYELLEDVKDTKVFEYIGLIARTKLFPKYKMDFNVKISIEPKLKEGERFIRRTLSVCPECKSLIRAIVFERDGEVKIRKYCPDHGEFEEVYWSDYNFYMLKSREAADGDGIENPYVEVINPCPFNCGLCPRHKSHTALLNLVVTNRCDLGCWYCFFYAAAVGYVFEPTLTHIRYMLESAREQRPIPAKAVQITGGEPTLRSDLIEIIKLAKELGYKHVQLNTHGIAFAYNPGLAKKVREAGVNTIYLSFDGLTPYTNPKNHWEIPYILEACKNACMGVVLVPTVIKNVNLHEVGKMVLFGLKHNDVVRGVNFQPISIVGRVPKSEREAMRVTIPDVIKVVEEETQGQIRTEDWYTVPFTLAISRFVEALTGEPQFKLSNHFACGVATYAIQDRKTGKVTTIPQFIKVNDLRDYLMQLTEYIKKGGSKKIALLKLLFKLNSLIEWDKVPENLRKRKRLLWILFKIFAKHDYNALGQFHYNTLFIGMMHFMDEYNYDVARVERCDIHYVMPDGRVIPFCTYNVFPEIYRDKAFKLYGIPLNKWYAKHGIKSFSEVRYKRNIRKLESNPIYRKYYEGFWDPDSISYEEKKRISIRFGIPVIED